MFRAHDMAADASRASGFLKALSNPSRLLILCQLAEGERSVSALERGLALRQPALSQQLARLRADGLVATRRDGKMIHYRLASDDVRRVLELLYDLFCADPAAAEHRPVSAEITGQAAAEITGRASDRI